MDASYSRSSPNLQSHEETSLLMVFAVFSLIGFCLIGVASALGYGIHRDELYFIDCGNRLDWGYVDHSFFVPLISRILGGNLLLFQVTVVALVAGIGVAGAKCVRVLGGTSKHQWLGALAFVSLPGVIGGASSFGTVVFEQFFAVWVAFAVLDFVSRSGRTMPLALFALTFFVGLVKPSGILLIAVYGLVLVLRDRRLAGAAVGLFIASLAGALPFLIWQSGHHWPILEFTAAQRKERDPLGIYLLMTMAMMGPLGLVATLVNYRRFALRWPLLFALAGIILFAVLQGKPYYCVPYFFPVLAVAVASVRKVKIWLVSGAVALAIGIGLLLPVWTPSMLAQPYFPLQDSTRERVDWKSWVREVVGVAKTQELSTVVTSNYGQAGALRLYSSGVLVPLCGHNQNAFWSKGDVPDRLLVVGYSSRWLKARFRSVTQVGILRNQFNVPNEEWNREIWMVSGKMPSVDIPSDLRHFD